MRKKIGLLKIAVGAWFLAFVGAWFFLAPAVRISAVKGDASDAENPQSCAACHQTEFDSRHRIILKRAAAAENAAGDSVVSCAECHSSAAEHLAAKTSVWARIGFQTENKILNPSDLSSDASMMICAQCHRGASDDSIELTRLGDAGYVGDFAHAHRRNDSDAERFWANGAHKFSGGEYQSVLRSVCYAQSKAGGGGIAGEKINCANCHSPHGKDDELAAEKSFDRNCVQCHAQFTDDAAIAEHTRHPLDSEASRCASCHQPEIVRAKTGFVRTHEISVPNPLLTAEKQIPNACNLCHADQSVNWAIAESKKLWANRFRDAKISNDRQFDRSEAVRALLTGDAFARALAANALTKRAEREGREPLALQALENEK